MRFWTWTLAGLFALAGPAWAAAPEIRIQDVIDFYRVYDTGQGGPTAAALQGYLDHGSDGLRQFTILRHLTGESIAAAMEKHPKMFADAKTCLDVLPAVKRRLTQALPRLGQIYPAAKFPPITILVGQGNTGGTTSASGVLVGLEALCGASWMDPNAEDRFVHLVAHEYVHVQQPAAQADPEHPVLLFQSLIEGGAEFLAELISGDVGYVRLKAWARGREKEVETQFAADLDTTNLKPWLYNGVGTEARPGDLAYWVGYRITKAYYVQAQDKRAAIARILTIDADTAKAFLADSGWTPGMALPEKVSLPSR
ncbi:DUF2268 domain-containing putative Zn-dependent protease [Nitrospirillum sp. BR 11163]|uniref:DUF2268 domain-containing putative Zn-dependent protease n=1 Tax=Nitrospirillum sp. BR 11163 TaxID=3104323 RepID=UPI002AFFCB56|nr:hypothetical protein [Nitrospirillum sp. BR 11163]MEA1674732.1 hypothetical protein [Nitrospirillum sp. BR 11163]